MYMYTYTNAPKHLQTPKISAPKTNMEPKFWDEFPFQRGDFQLPC